VRSGRPKVSKPTMLHGSHPAAAKSSRVTKRSAKVSPQLMLKSKLIALAHELQRGRESVIVSNGRVLKVDEPRHHGQRSRGPRLAALAEPSASAPGLRIGASGCDSQAA